MVAIDGVAQDLLERGLVTNRSVIDGDLSVRAAHRRNRNFRVTTDGEGCYFVKQPPEHAPSHAKALGREAELYGWCASDFSLAHLRPLVPRAAGAASGETLVTQLAPDVVALWDLYRSAGKEFPIAPAAGLGYALARVHRTFRAAPIFADAAARFPSALPMAASIHLPTIGELAQIGRGKYRLLVVIQEDDVLCRGLASVAEQWRPDTLIHGDVKMDNVLVSRADSSSSDVLLVDWECVQIGDAAWDLAGALHDFVMWWIVTTPESSSVGERINGARYPIEKMRPSIRALWQAYDDAEGPGPDSSAVGFLEKAVRYSAARLVQTACEMAHNMDEIPAPSVLALQVATNIYAHPDLAVTQLYGLSTD